MDNCPFCIIGFPHRETDKCQQEEVTVDQVSFADLSKEMSEEEEPRPVGRPPKDISQMLDPISTGRKQAAVRAPIEVGSVCEWTGLKYAGGGVVPITGCIGRPASDRHHGPNKSTLVNSRPNDGEDTWNLHVICDWCHNTWHAENDKYYGDAGRPKDNSDWLPVEPYKEHDPNTKATREEILIAEMKRMK